MKGQTPYESICMPCPEEVQTLRGDVNLEFQRLRSRRECVWLPVGVRVCSVLMKYSGIRKEGCKIYEQYAEHQ